MKKSALFLSLASPAFVSTATPADAQNVKERIDPRNVMGYEVIVKKEELDRIPQGILRLHFGDGTECIFVNRGWRGGLGAAEGSQTLDCKFAAPAND